MAGRPSRAPSGQGLLPLGDGHSSARLRSQGHLDRGRFSCLPPRGPPGPTQRLVLASQNSGYSPGRSAGSDTSSRWDSVWCDRSWASSSVATLLACLFLLPHLLSLVLLSTCPGRRGAVQSGWGVGVWRRAGQRLCPLAATGVSCPSLTDRLRASGLMLTFSCALAPTDSRSGGFQWSSVCGAPMRTLLFAVKGRQCMADLLCYNGFTSDAPPGLEPKR